MEFCEKRTVHAPDSDTLCKQAVMQLYETVTQKATLLFAEDHSFLQQ
jgi:hypothetical protein